MNLPEVKQSNLPATELMNEWGAPQVSAQDIIIPKILPMQGLSELVTQRKAMIGEFRDSLSGNKIGSIDEPFECIPFFLQKTWDVQEQQADGSFKWVRSVPVVENPASPDYNDNWKWEAMGVNAQGQQVKVKNVRRFNYYVLLPSEIESGGAVPYLLSFKSTSIKEGKKLFTQMYMRNIKANLPPPAFTIKVGGSMETNEKGSFVVLNYSLGRRTTDVELKECKQWIDLIRQGGTKIDETADDGPVETVGADGTGDY